MERISVDENSKHHRLMQAVVHLRGQSRGDGNILPATPNATNAMYGERERGDIHLVGEPVISFYALLSSFLIHFKPGDHFKADVHCPGNFFVHKNSKFFF